MLDGPTQPQSPQRVRQYYVQGKKVKLGVPGGSVGQGSGVATSWAVGRTKMWLNSHVAVAEAVAEAMAVV